jgi:hypothetical protein
MSVGVRLGRVRSAGWWTPAVAAYMLRQVTPGAAGELPSDDASLRGVAAWLARAQDATADGGIAGRYRFAGGWSSSYPETTGYAVPTLLTLAAVLGDDDYRARASRCIDFLLSVQLPSGAFPALEIADNRTEPSPFNSAQIVHGLHRWLQATGDRRVLDPLVSAARWICEVQDADGAWRRHFYRGLACTYSAHAACWLGEVAADLGDRQFRVCAERNLRWVLEQRDPETGWFDSCGFSIEDHRARRAHTHTIAYTLAGVLTMAERFQVAEGLDAVRVAAERLLERLERSKTLAGVLNHRWQPESRYVCLTGNAQLAVLWLRLAGTTGDIRFVNAACRAIDEVKQAQSLSSRNGGIRGGVPGSLPVGGEYIPFALPNWAAKFFTDALCAKRDWFAASLNPGVRPAPLAVEVSPAPGASVAESDPKNVVVYTSRVSPKFWHLAGVWRSRGFEPALVVVETGPVSVARQLAARLRRRTDNSTRVCRRYGWKYLRVSSINRPAAIAAIRATDPLFAVSAGSGLLRPAVLAVPRLGTLNAHMGLLPAYRGMNVAEWAALNDDPIGCSVFWVDAGIDTGPVIMTRRVDASGCESIDQLRERVDASQLAALDEVVRSIAEDGNVPSSVEQRPADGRQFFRMHPDLRQLLETRLRRGGVMSASTGRPRTAR